MNDVSADTLTSAVDKVNENRAAQMEDSNIASTNDQILEEEAAIVQAEADIEACRDRVRFLQRDIRRRQKKQDRLRQRREIFMRAAFELKTVDQP